MTAGTLLKGEAKCIPSRFFIIWPQPGAMAFAPNLFGCLWRAPGHQMFFNSTSGEPSVLRRQVALRSEMLDTCIARRWCFPAKAIDRAPSGKDLVMLAMKDPGAASSDAGCGLLTLARNHAVRRIAFDTDHMAAPTPVPWICSG